MIAYTSVYGNTKKAVLRLKNELQKRGYHKVTIYNLVRCDMSEAVAEAFRYSKLVLAAPTYNGGLFPIMREFIHNLTEREFQNRTIALIENGSWASAAAKIMKDSFQKSKKITFIEPVVKITSVLQKDSMEQLEILSEKLCE